MFHAGPAADDLDLRSFARIFHFLPLQGFHHFRGSFFQGLQFFHGALVDAAHKIRCALGIPLVSCFAGQDLGSKDPDQFLNIFH